MIKINAIIIGILVHSYIKDDHYVEENSLISRSAANHYHSMSHSLSINQ
jgi:hypothetical protein